MTNPYRPPKAAVGDVAQPPPLPLTVRVLRAMTIAGDAILGLSVLWLLIDKPILFQRLAGQLVAAGTLVVVGISIAALTSLIAERLLRWSAMLLNGLGLAFSGYLFSHGYTRDAGMVLLIPAILNMLAIEALRRARARGS